MLPYNIFQNYFERNSYVFSAPRTTIIPSHNMCKQQNITVEQLEQNFLDILCFVFHVLEIRCFRCLRRERLLQMFLNISSIFFSNCNQSFQVVSIFPFKQFLPMMNSQRRIRRSTVFFSGCYYKWRYQYYSDSTTNSHIFFSWSPRQCRTRKYILHLSLPGHLWCTQWLKSSSNFYHLADEQNFNKENRSI